MGSRQWIGAAAAGAALLAALLGILFSMQGTGGAKRGGMPVSMRSNLRMGGEFYHQDSHAEPTALPEGYQPVGRILLEAEPGCEAKENFSASELPAGTAVYIDPARPWQAAAFSAADGRWRLFSTDWPKQRYLCHDGQLYVALSSLDASVADAAYYASFGPEFRDLVHIPEDARPVGQASATKENAFPTGEWETNWEAGRFRPTVYSRDGVVFYVQDGWEILVFVPHRFCP